MAIIASLINLNFFLGLKVLSDSTSKLSVAFPDPMRRKGFNFRNARSWGKERKGGEEGEEGMGGGGMGTRMGIGEGEGEGKGEREKGRRWRRRKKKEDGRRKS